MARKLDLLIPKVVKIGLIRPNSTLIERTEGPAFKQGRNFIRVLSDIITTRPEDMGKFMNVLREVNIDPEGLRDFIEKVKKEKKDEELIKELGEEIYMT